MTPPRSLQTRRQRPGREGEADERLGEILASRYRVLERLGEGGMGVVYRVRDLTLDVDVALKLLPEVADAREREHVQREVRLARKVTHPNVCRLHDVTIDGADAFITMELIAGESLAARLARSGPLPAPEGLRVLREVAAGLAAAHAAGVIHRDLKPSNVLVSRDGRVVVADFGIATGDGTLELAGTRGYVAPEHVAGEPIDARADVYAFGVLACHVLAGRFPGEARSEADARDSLAAIVATPAAIRAALAGSTAELVELAVRCLAPEPAQRPADGAALVAELEAITRALAPPRSRVRRRVGWLAAGVAAIAITVGVWWSMAPTSSPATSTPAERPRPSALAIGAVAIGAGAERWAAEALEQALRDELEVAWGLAPVLPGPQVRVITATVERTAAGWRVAAGVDRVDAPTLRDAAAQLIATVVQREVPEADRAPSAAQLEAAGTRDPEAWRLWRRARRLAMLQHWDRVQELARDALARDPELAVAALELALAYDGGDAAQGPAIAHALALARRRPPGAPWSHAFELVEGAGDRSRTDRALRAIRAAVDDDFDTRYVELRYAIGLLVTGSEDEAVALLELARERWPHEGATWKALARHYVRSDAPGALDLALAASTQAMRLVPDDASVRADHALALVRAGRVEEARAEAALARAFDVDQRAPARGSLFAFHMALDELPDATAEALRMQTGSARAQAEGLAALAHVDLALGRFERGLAGLETAAETFARRGFTVAAARTRVQAARQALALGRRPLARALLDEVVAGPTAYRGPAAVLRASLTSVAAARAELARLAPDDPERRRLAVELAALEGDDARTIAEFAHVADPRSTVATAPLAARALVRSSRRDDARALYRMLASHPDRWREPVTTTQALRELGDLAAAAGDVEAARAAYEAFLARRTSVLAGDDLGPVRRWLAEHRR